MTARTAEVTTFLPAAYDVAWSLVVLGHGALLLVALVQWFRARGTPAGGVLDVLVIVLVPLVGPAAYLLGRRGGGQGRAGAGQGRRDRAGSPAD